MPRVLVVDDEPNVRWTLSEFLSRVGYETVGAADFDDGLKSLDTTQFDAAVIDVLLPGKSGIELLKEIHKRPEYLPVIMITADPDLSNVPDIVREGAYDFMAKPVVKSALLSAVARAVEKKRLTDEKRQLEAELQGYTHHLEELVEKRSADLAEAHNFLDTVLESSTEYAILTSDTMGRITLFNRGAELMFGYSSNQQMGKPLKDLAAETGHGGDRQSIPDLACQSDKTDLTHLTTHFRRSNGEVFPASVTTTPIRKTEGPVLGHLSIIRDLTQERRQEEALREMQARLAHNEKISALGRATAQVAHEVKNPLAGLRLYSLHLKKKAAAQLGTQEMSLVDKIIGGIDHLSDTVDRVLDFARPVSLALRAASLNQIVHAAVHMLEPQLGANKIQTILQLCEPDHTGMIDEAAFRSVLINLMLNSIQAMPDGGRLCITTTRRDSLLMLTITDTGCGMSAEQLERVFEPFYTTRPQGLGLGMPYARKIIDEHHGTIRMESRLNEGTMIEIGIPEHE